MNKKIITFTAGLLFLLSQTTTTFAASSIQFSAATVTVAENAGNVLVSVARTGDLDTVVTVDFLTADNSAKAEEDYTAAVGTLNFATGQTNQIIQVAILNDGLREAMETFSVMLTTRPPFQGATLETTIHEVLNTEPLSLRAFNPSAPLDLETICLKCLEKEP
ncbi:MAG: hypothetical protein HY043_16125 [Verrucomicrobia bacterium]|nr:hypothetical protein [Verrucomicrobiota bacterium]